MIKKKKKKTHLADLGPTWRLEASPAYTSQLSTETQIRESNDYCFKLMSFVVVCYTTLLLQPLFYVFILLMSSENIEVFCRE